MRRARRQQTLQTLQTLFCPKCRPLLLNSPFLALFVEVVCDLGARSPRSMIFQHQQGENSPREQHAVSYDFDSDLTNLLLNNQSSRAICNQDSIMPLLA
jgi:hypothetical protein